MAGRVVILGAGLTGLSASMHLSSDWDVEVHERESEVGGVARSVRRDGFTFDYTGHLLHLRSDHVKDMVARLLPDAFATCERRASVFSHGTYVPFPFQANLHGLPAEVIAECITEFAEALLRDEAPQEATSFREWSERCFGKGISRHFMLPYNSKLFDTDLDHVTADWVSWSVPRPSLEQVVKGALGIRNERMGYNATFLYPKTGGIDCLAQALSTEARGVQLDSEVRAVDLEAREVTLGDGATVAYDKLISTLPLSTLVRLAKNVPEWARDAGQGLRSVAVLGLNLGFDRPDISEHSWVYVPEADYPFYRVGFPGTFSPAAVPDGCSSVYVEVAAHDRSRLDIDKMEREALEGLRRMGVLRESDRVIARGHVLIDPAYVVFDAHRAAVRDRLLDELLERDVQSVGRYGAWTYSSMEDAILAGKEAAEVVMGERDAKEHRAGDR